MLNFFGTAAATRRLPFALAAIVFACSLAWPATALADSNNFVVLSDTHVRIQGDDGLVTNNADTLKAFKWAGKQNGLSAVIVAGDVTDRGYPGEFLAYDAIWDNAGVDALRIQCIGNHDTNHGGHFSGLSVAQCTQNFKKINGGALTTYTEFDYANVMTVGGAYTAGGGKVYTNAMLKQLNSRLKKTVRQGKMAIVVTHYPYTTNFKNSKKFLGILKSYPNVILITGHTHYYPSAKWFKKVKAKAKVLKKAKTPYKRAGIKAKKVSYGFRSLGVNSVSRNHSVGGVWQSAGSSAGYTLSVSSAGKVTYKKYKVGSSKASKTWKMKQVKGSITLKSTSVTAKKNGKITYQVVFSDGKAHGGMESGGTVTLETGKSKKIKGIPAGVLVTLKVASAEPGWSKPGAVKIEVTNKNRKVTFKHSYKKPKNDASSSSSSADDESSSSASDEELAGQAEEAEAEDAAGQENGADADGQPADAETGEGGSSTGEGGEGEGGGTPDDPGPAVEPGEDDPPANPGEGEGEGDFGGGESSALAEQREGA